MSYILEAIKKSEHERKQGDVPGVETVHAFREEADTGKHWWKIAFAIVISINIGLLVIWFLTETPVRESIDQAAMMNTDLLPQKKIIEPDIAAKSVRLTVPAKDANQLEHLAGNAEQNRQTSLQQPTEINIEKVPPVVRNKSVVVMDLVPTENPVATPVPAPAADKVTENIATSENGKMTISDTVKISLATPVEKPKQARDSRKIVRISELPDSVQGELPDLTYSGHVYSSNPDRRKLVINGRSMSQGEWLSDDIQLDEITMDGAIFSYKGYYYQIELLRNWSIN